MVVHTGPQHDAIEGLHRCVAKKRVLQPPRAVVAAEVQPERVLAEWQLARWVVTRADVAAALDANAAVHREAAVVLWPDQLGGDWTLPRDAAALCVGLFLDALGAPEVAVIRHQ